MASKGSRQTADEAFWRDFLTGGHQLKRGPAGLEAHPREPRCRLCAAPFPGIGAPVMRRIGTRPSAFADIPGSTALAEGLSSGEFHAILELVDASVVVEDHLRREGGRHSSRAEAR